MAWFVAFVLVVIAAVLVVLFLHRFYVKSSRDVALVRTGAGGRKVIIDGGALALPILHRVDRVNMRATRLAVERSGPRALIAADRLRVDLAMEFHVRVEPTPDGIATAAQALGSKAFREDELQALVEGNLIDAVQAEVARRSMDGLHEDRAGLSEAVAARLAGHLARSGLLVDAVSLIHLDQTPFSALDDSNAFDAVGMRRLAEVISENRKARIALEADTDIAIRKRQLAQVKERLAIEREQEEAEIAKRREIEQQRMRTDTELATQRTQSGRIEEEARIEREREVKQAEIERDLHLRKREAEALAELEIRKLDNAIAVAAKRSEETLQQAKTEGARAKVVEAQEAVQTSKDVAAAERGRRLAALKAAEEAEVDDVKVKAQVSSILSLARADAEATGVKGHAERDRLVAEAEGRRAQIEADNSQSEALIRARLETHKLDRLPEIVAQMMKPVEKIDSIRINQIAGLGQNGAGGEGGGGSPFNQALDSILGMSVQLPLMKKIGDEIGLDFDAQLAGRTADAAGRAASAARIKKDG
ncbi:SPFH domain-containing protein [Aquibium sp. A9E412]|uniref:flotillin family protein n=1 Tax=Aquibium sp. A9E412 TaxID=2976767 RepID=UPI0025B1A7E1|nr:flotillin domain-containing protein [Aquibium sp. A9E412]MDN2567980.1 SPFH domain-containing protein [Aquibium sp. A9E412]